MRTGSLLAALLALAGCGATPVRDAAPIACEAIVVERAVAVKPEAPPALRAPLTLTAPEIVDIAGHACLTPAGEQQLLDAWEAALARDAAHRAWANSPLD